MNASHAKENILKKIRKALSESTPIPFPQSEGSSSVYQSSSEDLEVVFAEAFSKLQGRFAFCVDEAEMISQLLILLQERKWSRVFCTEPSMQKYLHAGAFPLDPAQALKDSDVSITSCECLVARTGSVVMSAAQLNGRTASVYAPIHICIAYTSQLVYDIRDAMLLMKEKYSQNLPSLITFATGASRTADIEKTLVVGVHGPAEVYVFLVDSSMSTPL